MYRHIGIYKIVDQLQERKVDFFYKLQYIKGLAFDLFGNSLTLEGNMMQISLIAIALVC